MDFSNIADLLLSNGVVMLFVFLWGKIKTKMAYTKMKKALICISDKNYVQAIKLFEDIGSELKYDSNYWFNLGVAFIGLGAESDARPALAKSVALGNINAKRLLEKIS